MRVGFVVVAVLGAAAFGEPPRVVSASPDHGDEGVSADTKEIRVEFDQDMSPGGRSICGGGETFPKLDGTPRWESARVLVIPVTLEAGHEYYLSINCPSAQNFRSRDGERAEITPISFRTAAKGESPVKPAPLTPEINDAAIAALRKAIDERYSYRDRVVKDWDAALAPHVGAMRGAESPAGFARAAARALSAAEDVHVRLRVNHATLGTNRKGARSNFDIRAVEASVREFTRHNETVCTGRIADGPAYILIWSWPGDVEAIRPALDALERFKDAPALIVDVRPNGGGDESTAGVFASRFVEKPCVYSRDNHRDPGAESGWTRMFDRVVRPDPESARFDKPVAVLIGQACVSSNESFILMMKHGAGATLIGETTRGSSGNPRPHDLGNGVTVVLPMWQDFLPDGTLLEGRGIDPDLGVREAVTPTADAVLQAAVRVLSK